MVKKNSFSAFQKFGKSLMVPVALLPAAGIMLGLGAALSGPLSDQFPLLDVSWLQTIAEGMLTIGISIFDNLPVIFSVGVAIGLTGGAGIAGLAALVGYIIMNYTISFTKGLTPEIVADDTRFTMALGIPTLQTGVLGGILAGLLAVWVYKKFKDANPPEILGFFAGERSVGIITAFLSIFLGISLIFVWPPIQSGLTFLANIIASESTNPLLIGIYGFLNRFLIPTGLHHIWYGPFFWTPLGGTAEIAGQVVNGDQYIFLKQIAEGVEVTAGRFMAGDFAPMFGLAGSALAMYKMADLKNRPKIKGMFIAAAGTAILTGITEPIEFTFLFISPLLWVFHSLATALCAMLTFMFNIHLGFAGGSGLIDYLLVNALPNTPNWWLNIPLSIAMFILYYYVFTFAIKKWDLATPGRGGQENKLFTKKDYLDSKETSTDSSSTPQSDGLSIEENIIFYLGGDDNILDIDACFTRLRLDLGDVALMNEDGLKELGAAGVVKRGNSVQVVFGGKADNYKNRIKDLLNR